VTAFDALVGQRPVNVLTKTTWRDRTELARVVVAGDKAQVWAADGRQVVLRQEATVKAYSLDGRATVIETTDGETWRLVPAGCGCGSPLRAFRPPT
jgi:hypothetical protein